MLNNRGEKIARRGMLSPEIILHLASRRGVLEKSLIQCVCVGTIDERNDIPRGGDIF